MRILAYIMLFSIFIFLSACDNSKKETGTSLFDDLTSTSDYTEYLSIQNGINAPLMIFGNVSTWKRGIKYPVPGARVSIIGKGGAVTDINGNYYIKDIHLTTNASGEISQESATITVKAEGYSDFSNTITLNKGTNIEVNLSLVSSYPSDNPGGYLYGVVKDYYSGELIDSMEVYVSGCGTVETGISGEKGAFSLSNIPIGTHSVTIIDKNGFYQDYFSTINIPIGETHTVFEVKKTSKDSNQTGNVIGLVKTNGLLLESVEVTLDGEFSAITNKDGWFKLKNSSGSSDIPVGIHVITANPLSGTSYEIPVYDYFTSEIVFPGKNVIIIQMLPTN